MNVFKQLLKKEFGRESYDQYVMSYQKLLEKRSDQKQLYNQEVFSDIYDKLKGCDAKSLQERAKRLLDEYYKLSVASVSVLYHGSDYLTVIGADRNGNSGQCYSDCRMLCIQYCGICGQSVLFH